MNYDESIAYIESLVPTLERPTLERMRLFQEELGNPQDKIPVFHIGGTNGKGSTAAILDAILSSNDLRVGRFTGPHIIQFNERFSTTDAGLQQSISNEKFAKIATYVHSHSLDFARRHPEWGPLTWFEFLTAMSFHFFEDEKVDCIVLEVGLGGRFDATNVVNNVAGTVITNVALDHMHILGDTVEKIAFEKAGIIKKNVPLVSCAQGAALEVIKRQAQEVGAPLIALSEDGLTENFLKDLSCSDRDNRGPAMSSRILNNLPSCLNQLSLMGPHQKTNAGAALISFLLSPLSSQLIENFIDNLGGALSRVYFPGRMQFVPDKNLIMDGAHNPAGARALRAALDARHDYPFLFILGFFANKNITAYLSELLRPGDYVIACQVQTRRATCAPEEIVRICSELGIEAQSAESVKQALSLADSLGDRAAARLQQGDRPPVIVAGSFAVLKECMLAIGWQSVDDGRKDSIYHPPATESC